MKDLLNILQDCRPDVDFENETALIDDGILESLDIVMIVNELSDFYNVEISVDDLVPENFNSAKAMYELVQRLAEEG
ncbi:MAG: acyl carrier protein [Clostridia bacterium]|nr:acyl carrier protein [Clostridia bacterium]